MASAAGREQWRIRIRAEQQEREQRLQQEEELARRSLAVDVAAASGSLGYTRKLQELSFSRPQVWRAMKQQELQARQQEESVESVRVETLQEKRARARQAARLVQEQRQAQLMAV